MRKKIIDSIANNSNMSEEMMTSMLNSRNGKTIILGNEKLVETMLGNHEDMMKIMRDNPALMQNLMSDMLEVSKSDSGMMSLMYKTLMDNQQMNETMQRMNGGNKDMNIMDGNNMMNGSKRMNGTDSKTEKK